MGTLISGIGCEQRLDGGSLVVSNGAMDGSDDVKPKKNDGRRRKKRRKTVRHDGFCFSAAYHHQCFF